MQYGGAAVTRTRVGCDAEPGFFRTAAPMTNAQVTNRQKVTSQTERSRCEVLSRSNSA